SPTRKKTLGCAAHDVEATGWRDEQNLVRCSEAEVMKLPMMAFGHKDASLRHSIWTMTDVIYFIVTPWAYSSTAEQGTHKAAYMRCEKCLKTREMPRIIERTTTSIARQKTAKNI